MNARLSPVSSNARIAFRCEKCGACCRNLDVPIMLEPLDAFRIAEYLHRRGAAIEGTDEMLEIYAEPEMLVGYPIFTIKTDGNDNACVFLKDGRCDVYEARPHVCRVYPFSVAPGSRGKDFQYLLCEERPHHFGRGLVSVKDWMAENFSKETRAYLRAQSYWLPKIVEKIKANGEQASRRNLFQTVYYTYYGYDLEQPFLPQYERNMKALKELLEQQEKGHESYEHSE